MSGLATYLLGVLVSRDQFWMAATITVASMLLLELKGALEVLTKRISGEEIQTFTKFLLLTAVVLPVLPNQEFGPFQIDPASKVSCSWTGLRCSGLCRWFGWRVNSRRIPAVRPVVPD